MQFFVPRNWEKFQKHKRKQPPWIRSYVALLDDPNYIDMSDNCRAVLHGIWLLYARIGRPIAWQSGFIGGAIGMDGRAIAQALKVLLAREWIEIKELEKETGAKGIAHKPRCDSPETETETKTVLRTDAGASLKEKIWNEGLDWLAEHSEKPRDKLRPLVGRWLSTNSEAVVLEAMYAAARDSPVDPISWLSKRLQPNGADYSLEELQACLKQQ